MAIADRLHTGNLLIEHLPQAERRRILAACVTVDVVFGEVLCEADKPYRYVYFPVTAFISLVASASDHEPLEMGLIGSEGMLGATLALGIQTAPLRAIVQGPGRLLRITAAAFRSSLTANPALLLMIKRYLYVLMAQLSQTTLCSSFHELDTRLARWLLMSHDRAHADHFHLTHQYLADMLGVRRSGVSIAASLMQKQRLIGYTRGEISILNRTGLEAMSCECYAALVDDYAQHMSWREDSRPDSKL